MSNSTTSANRQNLREVHADQWIPFLADFTRNNRGAHARLEIIGPDTDVGYQVETEDRPFDGVSADTRGKERTVWIAFGSTPETHLTHGVQSATVIRTLTIEKGKVTVIEVESTDGTRTILELTSPEAYALPPGESGKQRK